MHKTFHCDPLTLDNERRFTVIYTEHTRVSGVLEGNAQLLQHADGSIAVAVRIKQPTGLPVLAELTYGRDPSARAAALFDAGEFVHGRHVQACGQGLGLDWGQDDVVALELQACSDIALTNGPSQRIVRDWLSGQPALPTSGQNVVALYASFQSWCRIHGVRSVPSIAGFLRTVQAMPSHGKAVQ